MKLPTFSPRALEELKARVVLGYERGMARPDVTGRHCVVQFSLPLELCPPRDLLRRARSFAEPEYARACYDWMAPQLLAVPNRPRRPLVGRPFVWCVRLSSVEPDADAGWEKIAVDRLLPVTLRAKHRLGLIVDDRPSKLARQVDWIKASPRQGVCYMEIWGDVSA